MGGDCQTAGGRNAPHLARGRRLARSATRLTLAAAVLGCATGVMSTPALALSQRGHSFGFSFGEKGEGLDQFSGPAGVAINESSGDVYVVDAGNQRVEVFHANGEPVAAWGWGVADAKEEFEECKAACKPGIAGTGEGQFRYPEKLKGHQRAAIAIAVDNSTNGADPSKGDVYVVSDVKSEQNVIEKFSPSGERLGRLPFGTLKTVGGLSVDANGVVWVQGTTGGAEVENGKGKEAEKEADNSREQALVELEFVERFSNAKNAGEAEVLSTVEIEAENHLAELAFAACPTAGIGITADGGTLYANHERVSLEEEVCAPEQEEINKEEKNKQHATVSSVTARLSVIGEPPTTAEPTLPALDSEYTSGIAVDQSSGNVYLDNQTSVAAFDSSSDFVQRFGTTQLKGGGGAGIAVNAKTGDVYVVDYKKNRVDVFEPEVSGPPVIDSLTYENITSSETKLIAKIDPHGAPTEAFFEYGTEPCSVPSSCVQTAPKPVGSGFGDVPFEETITGLQPATRYYFRVLAMHPGQEAVPAESELHTFTTLPRASGLLPDNRAWEMVSPAAKEGAAIEAIGGIGGNAAPQAPAIQAAAKGDGITYGANTATEEEPEGNRAPEAQQIISQRGPEGWRSKDIVTPHFKGEGLRPGSATEEYQLFSTDDLALGLVRPWVLKDGLQEPPLVPGVEKEQGNIYLRTNFDSTCEAAGSCFERLVTPENVEVESAEFGGQLQVLHGTPDLKHVVFRSKVPLLLGAPEKSIYEWSADKPAKEGQLKLVNVLPKKEEKEEPATGEPPPGLGGEAGELVNNARHAISDDGSRVIWTVAGHIYMRDMEGGHTIEVTKPEAGIEEVGGAAAYMDASKDGSRIFFTDTVPLTSSSTLEPLGGSENGANPADLYVCELEGEGEEQKCKLTDLSVDQNGDLGEEADLTQQILGASEAFSEEDGFNVYFVANGALAPGAVKGNCPTTHVKVPEEGSLEGRLCNLYLTHFDGSEWQAPKLIAILSAEDDGDWGAGPESTATELGHVSSRVSPNGRYLTFMSKRSLTGFDNRDVTSTEEHEVFDEEVFLFDAKEGKLVCASCNPFGARPTGVLDRREAGEGLGLLVDRPAAWRGQVVGQTLAGSIPTWTELAKQTTLYQSRYLSDEGRLFFNSPDQLVTLPAGEEFVHKENVYEYEPSGLGSCTDPAGCVALLTSGTSDHESAFIDASDDGSSVYFITAAPLVAADQDKSLDVYDARVCRPESPCLTGPAAQPRPCESTETCQGAHTPAPTFETPGTLTNSGPGNIHKEIVRPEEKGKGKGKRHKTRAQLLKRELRKCHKLKKHKKRVACERRARKRFGPKKAGHKTARGKR
ncbi:MAG: hypothetical protein E6G34_09555 [Actinobacteria bacterium]|nr:MAG: hypothetical protein E6G34_09555 [Actinomycetota bacterium]